MPVDRQLFLAAAAPALADLERTHPGRLQTHWAESRDSVLWLRDPETGSATGLWWQEITGSAEEVRDLTERVQEAAIDLVWGAWPECPEHPDGHPLEPVVRHATCVWTCPASGRAVARVGELPPTDQRNAAS